MILRTLNRIYPVFKHRSSFSGIHIVNTTKIYFSSSTNGEKRDRPIQYTKSKAYQYKAFENFRSDENYESTVPPYNAFLIQASIIAFLVWFGYLREPNDIDDMLGRDLFEIMPDLEIPMLEADIKRLESQGVNVEEMRRKLTELKRLDEEKKKKST